MSLNPGSVAPASSQFNPERVLTKLGDKSVVDGDTRAAIVRLYENDQVIVPVFLDQHWSATRLRIRRREAFFVDPLQSGHQHIYLGIVKVSK